MFANKIEMLEWHRPQKLIAPDLVAQFAARVALRGIDFMRSRHRSLVWRASYLAGVITAERFSAFLGIDDVRTNHFAPAFATQGPPPPVDAEAFLAGLSDMLAVGATPSEIQAFLKSERCRVAPEEFRLLSAALGGTGELPMPLSLWSSASTTSRPQDAP